MRLKSPLYPRKFSSLKLKTMNNIRTRRTIRKYKADTISEEILNQLLSDASRTQTMGNLQLYSVVVTRDEEMKRRLSPAHFNQPMVMEAPVVLTICADFRRTTLWCQIVRPTQATTISSRLSMPLAMPCYLPRPFAI